jgi:hypothetical protein
MITTLSRHNNGDNTRTSRQYFVRRRGGSDSIATIPTRDRAGGRHLCCFGGTRPGNKHKPPIIELVVMYSDNWPDRAWIWIDMIMPITAVGKWSVRLSPALAAPRRHRNSRLDGQCQVE